MNCFEPLTVEPVERIEVAARHVEAAARDLAIISTCSNSAEARRLTPLIEALDTLYDHLKEAATAIRVVS